MRRGKPVVLVVERESDDVRALVAFLGDHDVEVVWLRDGEGALRAIEDRRIDCMVAALRAPRIDGLALLRRARARHPSVCAVLVTDEPLLERAVEAVREGAYDVQTRPVHVEKLWAVLERGLRDQRLEAKMAEMQGLLDERFGLEQLTGRSAAMVRVLDQVRHVAPTRNTVLIEGEPGTGKGLLARAVHLNSSRRHERFAWTSCASLPVDVLEAELFGDDRDPSRSPEKRRGRLELASGGTLYLEAVDGLPAGTQVKLLRVVQERAYERLGGTETLRADVRLIVSSREDLAFEVRTGRFRDDLYQRLGVARIVMPRLRERREDIPLLVDAFIREFNRLHGRRVSGITRGALECLVQHEWPGNVRELKSTIEGMVVFAEGRRPLEVSDLPESLRGRASEPPVQAMVGMTVEEVERQLIGATLRHTGRDKPRAAAMLGIGLRTLYRKIKAYGLD